MERKKMQDKKSKMILLFAVVAILIALVLIANKTAGNYNDGNNEASSEALMESSVSVNNSSDMKKLKSSEYTSDVFDSIEVGDSFQTVEEKFGTLEKIDADGNFDAYIFKDENLGSNYVFYFSNDELKEVSVFLV